MKYQNVSNNNMNSQTNHLPISLKKKISIEDWELFESLADEHKRLWDIFWNISKDKKQILEKKICASYYFDEVVIPNLGPSMEYLVQHKLIDIDGISVILSLFINMIPKNVCEGCDCKTNSYSESLMRNSV
tara:strand:+ start:1321 stop:1713 length:393 start_codon:yes stop_codon:yes gene_type:complete